MAKVYYSKGYGIKAEQWKNEMHQEKSREVRCGLPTTVPPSQIRCAFSLAANYRAMCELYSWKSTGV